MPIPLKTRILLAEDHELVRGGLKLVLDSQPDLTVVAEARMEPRRSRSRSPASSTSPSSTSRCRS